ncbi:MAG: hypothetical protein AMXMBFR16_11190 [Candidatus Uhrbacteria bacterium]
MNRLVIDRKTRLNFKDTWVAWRFVFETLDARRACAYIFDLAKKHKLSPHCLRLRRIASELAVVNAKREIEEYWRENETNT